MHDINQQALEMQTNEPATPLNPQSTPNGIPTPLPLEPWPDNTNCTCPSGYRLATTYDNQTFTDLLITHDVSYNAMRYGNPTLSTTRIAPRTNYCIPPRGSRKLCRNNATEYIMGADESLDTLSQSTGIPPSEYLYYNPTLAPSDFVPGRVICQPT